MAEPFVGEIYAFPFPFAPKGWAFCDGRTLPTKQNTALFAILGTRFGGTRDDFALPDMRTGAPDGGTGSWPQMGYVVLNFCIALQGEMPRRP